jgi:hypothetical protein
LLTIFVPPAYLHVLGLNGGGDLVTKHRARLQLFLSFSPLLFLA